MMQPTTADLAGLSGLEAMTKIASGELPPPPISKAFDFDLIRVEEGLAVFRGHPGEHLYNPIGSVHGGVAATLIDSATGCAVHTTLAPGAGYTTVDLNVKFVRAIDKETGPIVCEGQVVHGGRRVVTATAELRAEETGKLLAHGSATCILIGL